MGVIVIQFEFWVELDSGVFFLHLFAIYGAATGTVCRLQDFLELKVLNSLEL